MGNPLPASSHIKVVNGVAGYHHRDQRKRSDRIDDTSATTFSIAFDGDTVTVARAGIKSIPRLNLGDGENILEGGFRVLTLPMNVTAGSGNDLIQTGEGNDTISAGDGNDQIYAGGGNDSIVGGGGDDTIDGGARGVYFMSGVRQRHRYLCLTQQSSLRRHRDAGRRRRSRPDDNVYRDVETVIGGAGNDTIHGGTGNNLACWHHGGNDQLFGGAGDDTLMGNAGSGFVLSGTAGIDTLNGEAGTDTAINSLGDSLISIENNLPNGIPDRGPFNTQVSEWRRWRPHCHRNARRR